MYFLYHLRTYLAGNSNTEGGKFPMFRKQKHKALCGSLWWM